MLASQDFLSLCWHLELSEQLKGEEEDASSMAWMV